MTDEIKLPNAIRKPYDPANKCPKCGNDVATVRWCMDDGNRYYMCDPPDHLHRTCQRCGYVWQEATLDTDPTLLDKPKRARR